MSISQKLKRIVLVPADDYEATLVSIDEEEGERGAYWKWSFEITAGDQEGVELIGSSSTTYSEHPSKSFQWARVLGHPADIDFDASLVENRPCRLRVSVEAQADGDGERNRIESVGAPTKSQLAAQPPSSDEIPF